jgi:hypothetical protein
VYDELRRIARYHLSHERTGHLLQTSALVNEAYLRLVDYKRMRWQDRAHFFAVSAQLMRRILVEHARRHNLKRGLGIRHVPLDRYWGHNENFVLVGFLVLVLVLVVLAPGVSGYQGRSPGLVREGGGD